MGPLPRFFLSVVLLFATAAFAAAPATIANDDSCDIALMPAATLLLPYFEVDIEDVNGETTLFTLTNVSNLTQVANVTIWTDYGYPIINFPIHLTGYDVQSISLGDVLRTGLVGTSAGSGAEVTRRGPYSDRNPDIDDNACYGLPGPLANFFINRLQWALTMGSSTAIPGNPQWAACARVGNIHKNAVGYLTVDLVHDCSVYSVAGEPGYVEDLRFDNVLMGDYQQINSAMNYAQVNPMVHIRAIPEGGSYAQRAADPARYANRFPDTFYGRYLDPAAPVDDGRQPLPSQFATRWIQGGPGTMETSLKIWRQPMTAGNYACTGVKTNEMIPITETVVFDDRENGEGFSEQPCYFSDGCPYIGYAYLPATSRVSVADLPAFPWRGPTNGWLYLNLDDLHAENGAHQNWVITSMRAEGRYSGDMDAIQLGNGCSPLAPLTEITWPGTTILGPAPNGN